MKVSELSGAQLDYWVAKAEGLEYAQIDQTIGRCFVRREDQANNVWLKDYMPSQRWDDGGPIIEREKIVIGPWRGNRWAATIEAYPESATEVGAFGVTYLEAAMRAYVASKFGEEVSDVNDTDAVG